MISSPRRSKHSLKLGGPEESSRMKHVCRVKGDLYAVVADILFQPYMRFRSIVVAGVGDGNMTTQTLEAAKRATAKGIPVVRSSHVPIGVVLLHGEVNDEKYGTVASDELNPQKARVLLMLALLKKRSREELQQLFLEY